MPLDKITDYSTTNASNSDVGGVGILGSNFASNMDNGLRELMTHLAETNAGTYPVADTWSFADPADLTKKFRFDGGSITAGQTRVLTVPNFDGTIATLAGTESLSNKTLVTPVFSSFTYTDMISGTIGGALANQDYMLVLKVPIAGTITETVTKATTGTATATFKVNTTALGGTANSVSTSENAQTHSSTNTFAANDDIVVTISSNSSCENMSLTIKFTRSLS